MEPKTPTELMLEKEAIELSKTVQAYTHALLNDPEKVDVAFMKKRLQRAQKRSREVESKLEKIKQERFRV